MHRSEQLSIASRAAYKGFKSANIPLDLIAKICDNQSPGHQMELHDLVMLGMPSDSMRKYAEDALVISWPDNPEECKMLSNEIDRMLDKMTRWIRREISAYVPGLAELMELEDHHPF